MQTFKQGLIKTCKEETVKLSFVHVCIFILNFTNVFLFVCLFVSLKSVSFEDSIIWNWRGSEQQKYRAPKGEGQTFGDQCFLHPFEAKTGHKWDTERNNLFVFITFG